MKLFKLFTLTLLILSVACNGKRVSSSENSNSRQASDTIIKYEPEEYQEKIIDTILDAENNVRVIIKKASRMDKQITQVIKMDSSHIEKFNWRDNSVNFKVFSVDQLKFDTTIVKEALIQIGDEDFLRQSILYNAWIIGYDKEKKTVTMGFNVLVPDTDWSYNFILTVDKEGKNELVLDEIE